MQQQRAARRIRANQPLLKQMYRFRTQLVTRDVNGGQRHILNGGQIETVDTHHRNILRHPQPALLQRTHRPGDHKISADQKCRWQRFACPRVEPFAYPLFAVPGAKAGDRKQVTPIGKMQVAHPPGLFDTCQPQVHRVTPQAHDIQHRPMAHIKQILRGKLANQPVIRRNGREAHRFVAAVDQHAGFRQIYRQIVNMRIVNAQQDRRFGFRFVHAGQELIGIAVILFQRAGSQAHLMSSQRMVDTLNDPVVIDIRTLIKRPLGRKDDQTVEQHTPGGNAFQYPHVARARQHGPPGLVTGVRFSCQHSGNRARRHPRPAGDLGYFELFIHFVIQLHLQNERIFIIDKARLSSKCLPLQ